MRKNVLCVLLSVLCMTVGALGEGAYEDIGALYQHWCMTEWPAWVCSVSSTDGSGDRLTVVVESQEAAEKLAAMIEDDGTLTVIVSVGGYTDSQLRQVQEEIAAEHMKTPGESPVVGIEVGWTQINGQVTGFGESGRESRVVVDVLTDYVDEYRELFRDRYGDMVYVEATDGVFLTTRDLVKDAGVREQLGIERNRAPVWYLCGLGAMLCVAVVLMLLRNRPVAATQIVNGEMAADYRNLTAQQVEALVTAHTQTPDEQVHRKILKQVEKE